MSKSILVLKLGSASITTPQGEIDEAIIADITRQVSALAADHHLILVSSGAVAAGKKFITNYKGKMAERKAAAAIGNPLLLNTYSKHFKPYHISIAQSLCERQHFSNRMQFLQLKETYEELWKNGIIPIANENDVVSNVELKFSDNDELATLLGVGFGASLILLGTSVPGVLDKEGNVIPNIASINNDIFSLANKNTSEVGLGGMTSKLTFAHLASSMGIKVVIFGIRTPDGILKAVLEETGTVCEPRKCSISSRNKWLASGSLVTGRLMVDEGACEAIRNRKSLLAVGVLSIEADFSSGEIFEIINGQNNIVAVARAKASSALIHSKAHNLEIANANDIVVL
ncbi:glutamate 5-kinase [Pedobacter metabolipauper]|uniref:Glutamate 5-kinase n=1 Tax=Pedobacter metabolipauper TaxID=425513 RepID=A0A4R6T1S9_9SPHI|nr:glutamate 5-kinase [Pedobacter metabolipauper]TDQ11460.1 glutamate 5-kinase [Pedobacter metabolipauper]